MMAGSTGAVAPEGSAGPRWSAPRAAGNGMAVAALVLGVLACVLFWTIAGGIVLGAVALVLGVIARRRARRGMATGGTMGVLGAVLGGLGLLGGAVVLVVLVWVANTDEFDTFQDCVRAADTQAEEDECAEDFSRDITE